MSVNMNRMWNWDTVQSIPYWLGMGDSGVHPAIRKLLRQRCIYSMMGCMVLQLQLLFIFLIYVKFNVNWPINSLALVLKCSFFSFATWWSLLCLTLISTCWGQLLSRLHQRLPPTQAWIFDGNLWALWLLQIVLGYCSSCYYVSLMDDRAATSLTGGYLLLNSCYCVICYALQEQQRLSTEVWPLPDIPIMFQQIPALICYSVFKVSSRSLIPTVGLSLILTACSYNQDYVRHLLTLLLMAQFHAIDHIFGVVMLQRLPLQLPGEVKVQEDLNAPLAPVQLPLRAALAVESLHGFRLQAAKDFYDEIIKDMSQQRQNLYALSPLSSHNRVKNWIHLSQLIVGQIHEVILKLDALLRSDNPALADLYLPTKRNCGNMRALSVATPLKLWHCQPRPRWKWISWCLKLKVKLQNLITIESPLPQKAYLARELLVARPLEWIIPGLAATCMQSINTDNYCLVEADIELIFHSLLHLEHMLKLVENGQWQPSDRHMKLQHATTYSIDLLTLYFSGYLTNLIRHRPLLELLMRRPSYQTSDAMQCNYWFKATIF